MKIKIVLIVLFISCWDCCFLYSKTGPDIRMEMCEEYITDKASCEIESSWHISNYDKPEIDFVDESINVKPPPPANDVCTGATDLGILDCNFFEQFFEDPEATPDIEATGICISNADPGQWYTFTTPNSLNYSSIVFGTSSIKIEIFKTSSDCSSLEYVDCDIGIFGFSPDPGIKYYLLATGGLYMFTQNYIPNSCDNSDDINLVANIPFDSWSSTECGSPSNVIPCENDHTVWYSITTGCNDSDIFIETSDFTGSNPYVLASELSISVFLEDCNTLASEYDVNELGYICSAVGNNETIMLEDIPPGTNLLIAFGSENSNMGFFNFSILVTTNEGNIVNDICDNGEAIFVGLNEGLTNLCATFSSGLSDPPIADCPTQYETTVWYEYDPGAEAKDIVINLLSSSINFPAIGIWTDCLSTYLAHECGSSIELICIDHPIMIQIGSSSENAGNFDLEIISTPSGDAVETIITGDDICTNSAVDILIDIPNGEYVNIKVNVSPNSSIYISGMNNPTFFGVTSAMIDDILVNSSTTVQEAIYTIDIDPLTGVCDDDPIEYTVLVYPALIANNTTIEECLPHLLELDVSEVMKYGTGPYSSVSWYWNGTDLIGSGNMLSYQFVENGEIIVEVIDDAGCEGSATIKIKIKEPSTPTFDFPLEYCRSDYDIIKFPLFSLENIDGSWNAPQLDLETTPDGFYDIEFTPNDPSCKLSAMFTIQIYSGIIPEFDLPILICSDEGEYVFPPEDLNGVNGSWDIPSIDVSMITGFQTNIFTPSTTECHANYEYTYEVSSNLDITFDQLDPICKIEQPITLSDISEEGFSGTWDDPIIDPSLISTDSIIRIWTPLPDQSPCINEAIVTIQIIELAIPEFNLPTELCASDTIYTFPIIDNQFLSGSWTVPTIDPNAISGTIQSIFVSDDYCIEQSVWEIEIIEPLVPSFNLDTTLCALDSLFTLPLISDNGIEGSWSSPSIDPMMTTDEKVKVLFIGESSDMCVESIEMTFDIIEAEVPTFDLPEKICWMESNLSLPTNSQNGIDGIWEPSLIDIQTNLGQTVNSTFTPLEGNCVDLALHSFTILAPYTVDIAAVGPSDCVGEDGSIIIDAGSNENMEYSIDEGETWQSSFEFNSLSSGGYTVLIRSTELSDCILEEELFLNSPDGPIINAVESIDIGNCITEDGSILIDATGNDLEYSINGGSTWQSSNEFNDLPSGSYVISIREALSDCVVEADANIEDIIQTQLLLVNALNISDCNANDGQIEIIAVGELLEYSIDNGASWSSQNLFKNLPSGGYNIIVRSTVGEDCSKESTVVLYGPNMPQIVDIILENPTVCTTNIGQIEINANGENLEYSFDGGISWKNTNVLENVLAGNYDLIVRDSNRIQCFVEDAVIMVEDAESLEESLFMITPPTDCELSNGMFEVMNSAMDLEYSLDGGMIWQDNSLFINLTSGTYSVITRIIALPNCYVEQNLEIPDVDCDCHDLIIDYIFNNISCDDEESATIELESIQGMDDIEIEITWHDGTIGPLLSVKQEGWQIYTINYDALCLWKDSIFIEMLTPITFEWEVQAAECPDRNTGKIEIFNAEGGSNNYQFSIDNIKYQSNNIFTGLTDGIYDVYVRDDDNCMSNHTIEVLSPDKIEIQLPDIEIVSKNKIITLNPSIEEMSIDSFSWTPVEGIINPNELIIEVLPKKTTIYTLEIFYGDCYENKTVTLMVEDSRAGIYFGNIFSPNGDEVNDFFYVQGSLDPRTTLTNISIYDRWGNNIFSNPNPQINMTSDGWDGSVNGEKAVTGVYMYTLSYTVSGVVKAELGTFTLVY